MCNKCARGTGDKIILMWGWVLHRKCDFNGRKIISSENFYEDSELAAEKRETRRHRHKDAAWRQP